MPLFQTSLKPGWTDAIRKFYRDERVYTFRDYLRNAYGRDTRLRSDHFLWNPALEKALVPVKLCVAGNLAVTMPRSGPNRIILIKNSRLMITGYLSKV